MKDLDEKLEEDEKVFINLLNNESSFKRFISKFTFLISTVPPLIMIIITFLLQTKIIYAFILIFIYYITVYWLIETKFKYIINFAQKTKQLILPYFQR